MTIFEDVKKLNLPTDQYAVVGSGVMSAHGIRSHHDVDLIVTKNLFEILRIVVGKVFRIEIVFLKVVTMKLMLIINTGNISQTKMN